MRLSRWLLVCVLMWGGGAVAAETAHVVILHVNDIHGQTLGESEDGKVYGGYPRLASAVDKIRREVGPEKVLFLHAGDEFSRGDALTVATSGAANIAILNALNLSAMTPGNGEYYLGAANLQKRIDEAKFPVLIGNVTYRLDGSLLSQRGTYFQVDGVPIGVMGLCFVRKEHPSALVLSVADPIAAAREIVPKLKEKSDFVIALDHLGLETDRQLAAAVPGIDLIVGGHSHSILPKGHVVDGPDGKPVLIVQAGAYLRYLGRVDLSFTKMDGHWSLTDSKATLIQLDTSIPEDPTIKAMIVKRWPATQPTPVNQAAPAAAGAE